MRAEKDFLKEVKRKTKEMANQEQNKAGGEKFCSRQRQIVHRDGIIRARSPSSSSSYLIDTDREFTAESVLSRKSL